MTTAVAIKISLRVQTLIKKIKISSPRKLSALPVLMSTVPKAFYLPVSQLTCNLLSFRIRLVDENSFLAYL